MYEENNIRFRPTITDIKQPIDRLRIVISDWTYLV